MAEQDLNILEAARTIYRVTSDDRIRALCEGRIEGEKTHNTLVKMCEMANEALNDANGELQSTKDELQAAQEQLATKDAYIAELEAKLKALEQ